METKRDAPILRINGSSVEGVIDEVASELPIRLVLNGEPLVTLLCTPSEMEELVVSFLLSEGLLRDKSSIKKMDINERETTVRIELSDLPADFSKLFETRTISSGCGKGVTFTQHRMHADRRIEVQGPLMRLDDIRQLLKTFRNISSLYLETGGVRSAALSNGKEILFFSEDIGRHNAVDKLIGKAFMKSGFFTLLSPLVWTRKNSSWKLLQKTSSYLIFVSRIVSRWVAPVETVTISK